MEKPRLYVANQDYHRALLASIDSAKERILLETMDLDTVGLLAPLLDACVRANQRGVKVTIIYDIRSYTNVVREYGRPGLRELQQWESDTRGTGITIHSIGARGLNPFAGRHHAKAALIDDVVYIGGGVNLTSSSFTTHDFMIRYSDNVLAQAAYDALPKAALNRQRDQIVYADSTTELFLDAGKKGQSLIYDRTCELAGQATRAWYVSMLAPDGRLGELLRQRETQYWYNPLSRALTFENLAIFIDQLKAKVTNAYRGETFLHAKFCVFLLPDGTYEAITGSHNFNSRGVTFGTQELAVHTKDQALCKQLIAFAESL